MKRRNFLKTVVLTALIPSITIFPIVKKRSSIQCEAIEDEYIVPYMLPNSNSTILDNYLHFIIFPKYV